MSEPIRKALKGEVKTCKVRVCQSMCRRHESLARNRAHPPATNQLMTECTGRSLRGFASRCTRSRRTWKDEPSCMLCRIKGVVEDSESVRSGSVGK
jgi:hypothetical protein